MTNHLFVTSDFPPAHGGVARYYWDFLHEFPKGSVTVLAPLRETPHDERAPFPIIRGRFFSRRLWPHWLPLVKSIGEQLKRMQPAYLHIGQVIPVGTAAYVANRQIRVPTVVYTHGTDLLFAQRRPWRRWIASSVLRVARWVVANSQFTADIVRQFGIPEERIVKVLPGVAFRSEFANDAKINHTPLQVLTVARLVERKGIDVVLQAIAQLPKTIDVAYRIVGEGPERQRLEALARSLGISERVTFVGPVDDAHLRTEYARCDIFVLTSKTAHSGRDVEGFGMAFLEASAFGKPSIAAETGGVAEAVMNETTGLLIPPDDSTALASALQRLVYDAALRQRLGDQGRNYVRENCLWSIRVRPLFKHLFS